MFWLVPLDYTWLAVTPGPTHFTVCLFIYVWPPWSAFTQSLSCRCLKHADIFMFLLPLRSSCLTCPPVPVDFKTINMHFSPRMDWQLSLTRSQCPRLKRSTKRQQCEMANFLVWGSTWKGGPSGLCQAPNEAGFFFFFLPAPLRPLWLPGRVTRTGHAAEILYFTCKLSPPL